MFLTVYYRDFFMKSNSNIVCLQHRCIAYQNNCHIDLYTGWTIVKYYQCFKYTFFFSFISHLHDACGFSDLVFLFANTDAHPVEGTIVSPTPQDKRQGVCGFACLCVYLSECEQECVCIHACTYVWFTTVWANCQWAPTAVGQRGLSGLPKIFVECPFFARGFSSLWPQPYCL